MALRWKPSHGRQRLSVHFIEGSPERNHSLKGKILAITVVAAYAYAVVLDCRSLRIAEPAAALAPLYLELGFELVEAGGKVRYCERRID